MTPQAAATRPRVEGEREVEIFDATARLLVEQGYDRLTFDAIAAAVKASKATLYRRWAGKADLVIDTLKHLKRLEGRHPVDTGSLREDLLALACGEGGLTDEMLVGIIGALVPALHRDPDLGRAFRERFIGPKLDAAVVAFERARERGEVGPDADLGFLARILPSMGTHEMFVFGTCVTRDHVARIVDEVVLPACRATLADH
ncbi:MAG: TetR/AcrR family transcriptional regulator [Oryzihumus sp.]